MKDANKNMEGQGKRGLKAFEHQHNKLPSASSDDDDDELQILDNEMMQISLTRQGRQTNAPASARRTNGYSKKASMVQLRRRRWGVANPEAGKGQKDNAGE
ncbi:hypothetical protein GW17_00022574 [Ensete ventricosum]|nr:hypothetical protein GW17_00022574 [Ensete ventricosum]RZR89925.1 hypothetical protein BHM03_00017724 [Ensete ventricosum]